MDDERASQFEDYEQERSDVEEILDDQQGQNDNYPDTPVITTLEPSEQPLFSKLTTTLVFAPSGKGKTVMMKHALLDYSHLIAAVVVFSSTAGDGNNLKEDYGF